MECRSFLVSMTVPSLFRKCIVGIGTEMIPQRPKIIIELLGCDIVPPHHKICGVFLITRIRRMRRDEQMMRLRKICDSSSPILFEKDWMTFWLPGLFINSLWVFSAAEKSVYDFIIKYDLYGSEDVRVFLMTLLALFGRIPGIHWRGHFRFCLVE